MAKNHVGKALVYCQAAGKKGHVSKGQAKLHLKHLRQKVPHYDGHAYRCHHCRRWHVGRRDLRRARLVDVEPRDREAFMREAEQGDLPEIR